MGDCKHAWHMNAEYCCNCGLSEDQIEIQSLESQVKILNDLCTSHDQFKQKSTRIIKKIGELLKTGNMPIWLPNEIEQYLQEHEQEAES